MIGQHNIVIYGNESCAYCAAARMLLTKKGVQFHGGNAVAQGAYDLKTGKCLTPAPGSATGVTKSMFYVEKWVKAKKGG